MTNVKTGSCNGVSVIGLGYDVQGNLSNKNGTSFAFDYGNRLRSTSAGPSSYVYDGHGRRVRDWVGASKYSLYSQTGQLAFASDLRIGKYSNYLYLNGSLVAIREQPHVPGPVVTKYLHTDSLGTPVAVTDQSKVVIEKSEYEPCGQVINHPLKDGPNYTGHVADATTGMIYMQQRYYDAGLCRFPTVDPIASYSKRGISFNRYWYANNNPYRFTDPDGRWTCERQGTNCDMAQAAAKRMDAALRNANLSAKERGQLQNARNYIGDYNDPKNNVIVRFGEGPKGAAGYVDKSGNIVLDVSKAMRTAIQGSGLTAQENTENALARNLSHEADHAARYASREAWTMTRDQMEVEGYRAAAIYQKGANWLDNSTNAWYPTTGISESLLESQATLSKAASCYPYSTCN